MKTFDKYWKFIKRKSPTFLAILGSAGTGVTAYLAARNEAEYQHERFDYYIKHGMFPEDYNGVDLTKDELRKKAYSILGNHAKHHITTFVSGSATIASILGGAALGNKQNAALMAMNVGIGNMMAKRRETEYKAIEKKAEENKCPISKEDIQDYLIREAYFNEIVYYSNELTEKNDEELLWIDIYPENKIFVVNRNDVNTLQWYINALLKEQNSVSYGEIFERLNVYDSPAEFIDDDINQWINLYGFAKDPEDLLTVEVYTRSVEVEKGVFVTALSFSMTGCVIEM